ncbi:hypothetical protein QQ054_03170 [Oscillatoria amoena NRMC-F 0135]|nr:hypothetical protein [Oscillatoria amoena NRMC-F 0135]
MGKIITPIVVGAYACKTQRQQKYQQYQPAAVFLYKGVHAQGFSKVKNSGDGWRMFWYRLYSFLDFERAVLAAKPIKPLLNTSLCYSLFTQKL